jgi:hypothetical protein
MCVALLFGGAPDNDHCNALVPVHEKLNIVFDEINFYEQHMHKQFPLDSIMLSLYCYSVNFLVSW